MSKLSEALKELGYSEAVSFSLSEALKKREATVKTLSGLTDTQKRIQVLGEFITGVSKGMLAAGLDPASEVGNISDREIIVSVISTVFFELSVMMMMITDGDRDKALSTMFPILTVCLDEGERLVADLKEHGKFGKENVGKPFILH